MSVSDKVMMDRAKVSDYVTNHIEVGLETPKRIAEGTGISYNKVVHACTFLKNERKKRISSYNHLLHFPNVLKHLSTCQSYQLLLYDH